MNNPSLWDPFETLRGRRLVWAFLAVWTCVFQGPAFLETLRTSVKYAADFSQDWISARFLLEGVPVYADQTVAIERDILRGPEARRYLNVNGHPPASILLVLPLARLDYADALLAWNLFSLGVLLVSVWLVLRELGVAWRPWGVFPLVTLLLLCVPVQVHLQVGQISLVLLVLLVGMWLAERRGRPWTAGLLLAAATSIKLIPALLFVYYLLRREWRTAAAGAGGLLAITLLTVGVMGLESHATYLTTVLPLIREKYPGNESLSGLWHRLFDVPDSDRFVLVGPDQRALYLGRVWLAPAVVPWAALVSQLVVLLAWAGAVWRARNRAAHDQAFATAATVMLLVSPISWYHSLPLLWLPLAVVWRRLPASMGMRLAFLLTCAGMWINPLTIYTALSRFHRSYESFPGGLYVESAGPFYALTVFSLPCYAMLALFVLGLALADERRE